ncbi:sugar ABC transporter ATP-binding protein [Paracoccus sp. P2]|uniref:Sugar ABC transporter ATP-binding protein n=1 Tax=Paracoccus pantotrophus TaxID=82367 RepID=A0A7H9BUD2_PARPN|nr:sugar ABC transporter ATP-binding protein [Paracoccus pantotrophus]MDF3853441.1 sugar ABC transporter ATP-binding protein [Paracoccus pantotrophus]QLH14723.1 sugar ABC transporter ATP-binding protein [Paracoccus pantotrophus]RDD98839.1 sugar ABC transporter ATP-binding protein [Paracoccus pantotrophus]RNI18920.1 sugar ABC transporter ATP-binding protein [Paracoccus pantotrophus]WGR64851.1 sugar ABC transporter ATP-binding protein [Paracoccus pantotrophus]
MLELKGIRKSFGKIEVLHGVDMQVRAGEVHALLGENGAGKSTLMKILCGIVQPSEGMIRIEGTERHFADYDQAIAAGVGIVFQEFSLIPYLDAVENMFLAREMRGPLGMLDRKAMRARAAQIMRQLAVDVALDVPVHRLSVAEQQFVEIAKALSLNARILVLDEPTATLTPSEVEHLFKVMRELRKQGVAIIFISHHLEEIFEICDRITVLRDGEFIGSCAVSEVDNDRLVEMMVGRRIESNFPPKPATAPAAPLAVEVEEVQLKKGGPVSRFALRKGEILGFAGLVGSGRTETVLAMLGAYPAQRCKVRVDGVETRFSGPDQGLAHGIGLLPESRKEQGLITSFSILQNVSLNNYGKYRKNRWFIDLKKELAATETAMAQVRVKAQGPHARVDTLSGGNQQKVVIARWLNHDMNVLIFDEPTRGIDVGAKAEIYALMRAFTEKGGAIIMISSELPEVIGMSDRVCVFRSGGIVATVEGAEIDSETIMTHATTGRVEHVA